MIFTPSQKQASTVSKSSSQDSLSQTRSVSCFVLSPLLSLFVFCVHMALPFFQYHYCFLCGLLYYVSGWCKCTKVHFGENFVWCNCFTVELMNFMCLFEIVLLIQNGAIHIWRNIFIPYHLPKPSRNKCPKIFQLHQKWCLFYSRQLRKRHHFWCSQKKFRSFLFLISGFCFFFLNTS